MLLPAPAFAYAALQKITLDCSLEEFFRYGNYNAVHSAVRSIQTLPADARHTAVLTFGKKLRDGRLAAQSFFLRKSITDLPFHG